MIEIDREYHNAFHVLAIVAGIIAILVAIPSPAQAAINVTPSDISTNYIRWGWTGGPLTGISIDGALVQNFDPNGTSFILSDLNPGELHQIKIYTAGDTGTNTTRTLPESKLIGDVPIGLWLFALVGVFFLFLAKITAVRFINIICIIFGLIGVQSLVGIKETLDPAIWSLSLIVYAILLVAGGAAYLYTGRR